MLKSAAVAASRIKHHLKDADVLLALSAIPVIMLFILAPNTFELSWAGFGKLGRGGLFFVLFFLGFEILDFRNAAHLRLTRGRKIAASVAVILALVYFVAVGVDQSFVNLVYSLGKILGAAGEVSNSWLMSMDYLILTLYMAALAIILFNLRALKAIVTPIVLGLGMLAFYLLDAFFPYGEIGPLQFWANFIVAGVALLSKLFGLPIYGLQNYLTIAGTKGFFRLAVYWPSVGVQSMIIYSLVMIVVAAKLDAPLKRKLTYVVVGVAGTIFLNVIRIFAIAYYGYAYATTGQQLDAFHNSIGEILFPIWIAIFLVIVLQIENMIAARKEPKERHVSKSARKGVKTRKSNEQ
jgi:thaumarchaeosortase